MQNNPYILLLGLAAALWLGAQSWRRRKLRRAMQALPTRLQRQLGPEPEYAPPATAPHSPELEAFARLHRRTAQIQTGLRGLAAIWLLFVIFLVLRKQFP
ncbi:hypothetical protein PSA7680_01447 [Pseudoruegeria aquimaris]|uniref:Uncharacterized protein n=1 Tax=Pseudoruegeria aquimaris TaxID=393663 RepID=A0A1Y5S1Q6_9RHOB|nr:hypothetical protein [Pseudoruegeria aquimaris]SLN30326.1 hypothetical protein PSA7680_01447 [Pseudoruegeria aquimaris]